MRHGWCVTAALATLLAGCGQAVAAPLLRGAPATYLLGVDQLVSPGFSLDSPPRALTGAAGGAGFTAGATEDFFRAAGSLALANGPVQVGDSVEEFAAAPGAATQLATDVRRLDAVAGSSAVSTGSLGDAAHATTRTAVSAQDVAVVEFTVEWRVDNLLDVLVVRGRSGATRLDDALLLAHRQTVTELALSTPSPS